jgi:hypothetical protein
MDRSNLRLILGLPFFDQLHDIANVLEALFKAASRSLELPPGDLYHQGGVAD